VVVELGIHATTHNPLVPVAADAKSPVGAWLSLLSSLSSTLARMSSAPTMSANSSSALQCAAMSASSTALTVECYC
jgi:hypothetical protein